MQVHVESAEGSRRRVRVVVPASDFQGQVEAQLKQTAKKVKLKGFRPGKVPLREVQRRFGAEIREEVSSRLVKSTFDQALLQLEAEPVGMPKIQALKCEDGKDLEYTALFDVLPELQVGGLKKIAIERPVAQVETKDLDRMVETLRDQRTTFEPVERGCKPGDQVTLDCEARLEGEVYGPACLEDAQLLLNGKIKPAGFEKGLLGLKAGEGKALELTMPKDAQPEVAGKPLLFNVQMKAVAEARRPKLDDAFFQQFDLKEGGLKAFRAEVKSNMERELAAAVRRRLKAQAIDGLIAQNPFDAPQSMIDMEAEQLRQQGLRQWLGPAAYDQMAGNLSPETLPVAGFLPQAERLVRASILIRRLLEARKIQPDEARVRELIETEASSYEDRDQVISFFYENQEQLERVKGLALEDQVVDLILEEAKVKDKRCSYEEAVKPPEPAGQPAQTKAEAKTKAKTKTKPKQTEEAKA